MSMMAAETQEQEIRAGSARSRRRERRAASGAAKAPAYIRRQIPVYDLLPDEALEKIEATADRILEEIGIAFTGGDQRTIDLWKAARAEVDGERVRFPKGLVQEILKTAPRQFTHHARNPARSVEIGGDNVVFAPAYGSPFVMDLDRGRRYGTIEDFENFVKLAYASPWLHHSGGTVCEPTDVPVNKRHLDMVYAHVRYSDKAFLGSITAEERAEDSVEMARIVFGADFADGNCCVMGNVNVNSPLVWDATMTRSIRAYARANQGSIIVPFILGGAMGPVTNAGAIAQAHAETLVGCALSQLERPGAPTIYGNFLSSMSLRSGSPTFGTPEPALGSLVVGQLARRAGLPLRCSGAFTTSKLPDAQSMMESVTSMHAAVQCGANYILHAAGFLDGLLSMSYEKFVLDVDYCGALHTYLAGITVDDNALALDAFREVGPGGHFFGCAHTMANYENAFFDAELSDNTTFEQWSEAGSVDSMARANARWKTMLAEYAPPPLDEGIDEALRDFIARRKDSMEDAWY
ncbi:MAG: trimethylamine methyltransferase family protein [Rhodobiaceae bacterium]|nr:trimethylamine methyltransferase family protein [Rhodobiaceae bacterium]